jgi:hypothetical protein
VKSFHQINCSYKTKSIYNSISGGIKDLQIENKKRKNSSRAGRGTSSHRTESEVDSHDSSSISTLDQAVKQWMVAAAKGNSCLFVCLFVTEATQFCVTAGSTLI